MRERRPRESRAEQALVWLLVLGFLALVGWCSHALGTSRATLGDVRAVQTQVAERCR